MSEHKIKTAGRAIIEEIPPIYWQWQQEMRKLFPEHWEKIKGARDPSDVIMYMNGWLGTDAPLTGQPVECCELWLAEMRKKQLIIIAGHA